MVRPGSADGAYDTKACHEAIAGRQAEAIIPTRRNATPEADECAPMWLKASQTDRRDSDQHDHGPHDAAR